MDTSDLFVKFVYDDSVLNSRLEDTDEKLQEHDELIKELQNKIGDLPTNTQLEFMRDSMMKDFEKQISEMNNKYQTLLNQYNSMLGQIKSLSDTTESKINSLTEYIDTKAQQNYDNIMISNSNDQNRFNAIDDRISECEGRINNQKKDLKEYRTNVQHIASAIASFNDTDVALDKNLQGNLKGSVNFVKMNLQKIYDDLARIKNTPTPTVSKSPMSDTLSALIQQQQQSLANRGQSSSQKPSILSPHIQKPQVTQKQQPQQIQNKDHSLQQLQTKDQIQANDRSTNESDKQKTENENESKSDQIITDKPQSQLQPLQPPSTPITPQPIVNQPPKDTSSTTNPPTVSFSTPKHNNAKPVISANNSVTSSNNASSSHTNHTNDKFIPYDLNKVRPYSEVQAHWHDKPKLPDIRPFLTIEEVVDHVYKMQPYLQAYLYAMHGKMVESWNQIQQKVDKNLVEKMFERMQSVVADINIALDQLKDEVQQTASRREINSFIESLSKSMRSDTQTSVGRVRCIACGRETMQVTGAMTEAEINRTLGSNTPNSMVKPMVNHKTGIAYGSMDGFDSAIVEEPRSKRPAQSMLPQSQSSVKAKGKL